MPPCPVAPPAHPTPAGPCWMPLPGSAAFLRRQEALDCATLTQVAACLRRTVREITPLLDALYFKAAPLAVLDCCATLEALAQEVEQDDVQTVAERAQEDVKGLLPF
ncbi:hypothetical protein Amal_03443 [Acetobacter malorum]|uniref:Uncharacterized protein n=1 Tax=Acetobacter malorum TaxID=178901 RepID=A0A177G4W9_9PROT|nr:hypothetical protein [Acetobacter malorum]OAG75388.1 hypothetical protein Amal_03443 [Acetobacter malorum]